MISQQLFVFIFLTVILLLCEGLSQPKSVSQLIDRSHIRSDAIVQSPKCTTANTHLFNLVCDERFNNFRVLDKLTQKTQQFRNEWFLMVLSVVTGTITAAVIVKSKLLLSVFTSKWPKHWLTSLAGGIIVSFLLIFDKNLSVNPFTLPLAINPKQSNRKEELHTTVFKNEWSALSGSGFSLVRQVLRLIATMLAVSSGNSLGFTAAAVEVGMTVAHLFGQLLPVQPDGAASLVTARENMQRRKYLLLAGAAAGIAVNSNAPFTGILYSAEIASNMLSTKGGGGGGESRGGDITAVKTASLLATVASAVLALRMLSNPSPVLRISQLLDLRYLSASLDKVPMFLAIGVMSGYLSYIFTLSRTAFSALISSSLRIPVALRGLRPLIGGLLCSLAAYMGQSQAMGGGYARLNDMLSGEMSGVGELSKFLVVKFVATVVSLSTFPAGGLVAPSMFLGSAFGALFYHTLAPHYSNLMLDNVSVYLLLGAASYLAAIFRAPLTASMLVVEMTNSQALLVPLLIATSTAGYVTHRLHLVDEK